MSWIVLLEWDGNKPPSTFYRRMHRLALRVRGDKEQSPLDRRDDGLGVIFQEGAIIVPSESFARTIGGIAKQTAEEMDIAVAVQIGQADFKPIKLTAEDKATLKRIGEVFGKRGRREADSDWTVACFECLHVEHVAAPAAVNCPHCGSTRVRVRPGKPYQYRDPGGPLFEAWRRTRFVGLAPRWEPVINKGAIDVPPTTAAIADPQEAEIVECLRQSPLLARLEQIDRRQAVEVLDAILIARAHSTPERRLQARVAAAAQFFQVGGQPSAISIAETPQPDLLDAAELLGTATVAALLLKI